MADYDEFDEHGELSRSRRLEAWLEYGGWVIAATAVVWGIYTLVQVSQLEENVGRAVLSTLVLMFAGIWGGIGLRALAAIIRHLIGLQEATEEAARAYRNASVRRFGPPEAGTKAGDSDTLEELVLLMREVRDISLLTGEQRALRVEAQGKAALNHLQREVPALLREHNWIEARNRVEVARERFPSFVEWDALEKQIEGMRAQVESHDIEAARRQIDDLASLGAWDRVAEVLNELLERHPDSVKANELAHDIRAQRNKAEAEQRARLMAQAQEATNAREWKKSLQLASMVIQRFPRSPEAQALRMQLPTLQENAEIQIRQSMESEIRELVRQHRFDEALRIANELLQQYPDSPQAAVLREQLPRLEEKASSMGVRY